MTEREALKQLLEALDKELPHNMKHIAAGQRFNARTALAKPEQEPVACVQDLDEVKRKHLVYERGMDWKDPLYTTPPQRKPLTQDLDAPLTLNGVAMFPRQQPLTVKELNLIAAQWHLHLLNEKDKADVFAAFRAIEAAHGIKGDA